MLILCFTPTTPYAYLMLILCSSYAYLMLILCFTPTPYAYLMLILCFTPTTPYAYRRDAELKRLVTSISIRSTISIISITYLYY